MPVAGSQLPGAGKLTTGLPGRESETIEPSKTEKMEVHHHGHVHPQKKWKEYLFEFLMLFLAVFCGFLAENQREHFVEAHRAKEYAKSLMNDLALDTAELRQAIEHTVFTSSAMDSCIAISSKINKGNNVPGTYYYYSRFTSNAFLIDWSRSTITQLVQSGNLRFMKNKDLVNKINEYYALQQMITSQNETDRNHRLLIMELRNRFLLNQYFDIFSKLAIGEEVYGHTASETIDGLMARQLPLQQGAEKFINEFNNHLSDRKARYKVMIETHYPQTIKAAVDILNALREEYHLKDR